MALFGFGRSRGEREQARIRKLREKVVNRYGQAIERTTAMRQLRNIGTPEAWEALLDRYTINLDVTITDQDEKRELYEWLVAGGDDVIAPIESFVSTHDGVYWPLRALKEIAGIDRAVDSLLRALDRAGEIQVRVNEQRAQLVSNLRDFEHPRVLERLKTLILDPDDDVRMMALDGLMTYGEDEAVALVAERILNPEENSRIRHVLLEQLLDLEWSLARWKEAIEEAGVLPDHYQLNADGVVIRGT